MDVSNITYSGIDIDEVRSYKFIEDILINKIIKLEHDVETIYKISVDTKIDYNGTKKILSGINQENIKCDGNLSDITLNFKVLIEYTNSDKLLGVKRFDFIETKYIQTNIILKGNEIKGKVRNVYICRSGEEEIYISIYYILIV